MGSRGALIVAMSGGVDSSVAAALLREQGWDLLGVTLRLLDAHNVGPDRLSRAEEAEAQARTVAEMLGFPHRVLDASAAFEAEVLAPAWRAYAAGRTPSPCLCCNRKVKFGLLMDEALRLGAAGVATGHYVRRVERDGEPALLRGVDPDKDQSYFLFALGPRRLARAFFPLGSMKKTEVRARAAALGLPCAARPGSQDACFAAGQDDGFAEALRAHFSGEARAGDIVDPAGRLLGRHDGLHRFTVGQRRGLGVALGRPAWVSVLDPERATVTVTTREEDLLSAGLLAEEPTWLRRHPEPGETWPCEVQIRYRARPVPAAVTVDEDGRLVVRFVAPQRAVTPGQAAVLYRGERVLGGGWIEKALAG